jgi:putative addiction module killer protein
VIEVRQTEAFSAWMSGLRDLHGVARLTARIRRLTLGHFGDAKAVSGGVSELRIDHGPGYRIYFARRGALVVLLLCGGDKSTQRRDIERAKAMLGELSNDA